MMEVAWAKPRLPEMHLRVAKAHLFLTVAATRNIGMTHCNVGITEDGVIVIVPGDNYTVSRRKDSTARIGGAGLVRQLMEQGAMPGNYKLLRKGGRWEGYPVEVEGPELPQDLRPKRGRRKGTQ